MARIETWLKCDLQAMVRVQELDGDLFTADNQANRIGVIVTDKGVDSPIQGGIVGYVIRPDEATVIVDGTASGNRGWIDLPASAYVYKGPISIVIKNGNTTIGACHGYMNRSTTDAIVDPGRVIPSISELLAEIANMRAATAAANTATDNANAATSSANMAASNANAAATAANTAAETANTAASNADTKAGSANTAAGNANKAASAANTAAQIANTSASNADTKAGLANTAASNANAKATLANTAAQTANTAASNADEKAALANTAAGTANASATAADTATAAANAAAGKIDNMTVAATTSPEGSQASATITEVNGHKHIAFGVPKGDKGKDFHIAFTFTSIAAMEAYSGDIELFDYAMIDTGNVQDADTGKLYCYEQDGEWHYIGDLSGAQGIKGETGTGIDHISLNADYTLTIYYTDGTSDTTPSIRGAIGVTPNIAVGTVTTLLPDQQAYVTRDPSSTAENPVFNFGIPKGNTGSAENIYGTSIPMSESDSTTIYNAIGNKLDKNQGTENTGKFMKVGADGSLVPDAIPDPTWKADKVQNAVAGNFAGLDANGNLIDSGNKPSDFLTQHQDISGKADKVQNATAENFAGFDANGNLIDSGKKPSDILTQAAVVDLIYPVGSIYMSVASTSPATLFDGTTWEQLKDRFLLGAGDTYTAGDTGGNASVSYTPAGTNSGGAVSNHTLTVDEIPSHNHGFTGSAVNTGKQSAGHTHTYKDYYATTTGNTAITTAQMPSHSHYHVSSKASLMAPASAATSEGLSGAKYNNTDDNTMWNIGNATASAGSGNNHNHSGANTNTTRTSDNISADHTHSVTASGSIGNKGGGGSHGHGFTQPTFTGTQTTINTMPPYLAVYMWKRTA